jgi:hypothetical protein
VDEIFFQFLCSLEKPEQPEVSFTLCLDYTSSKIEYYLRELANLIKNFIPKFNIRFAYKFIRIENIYKKDGKAEASKLDSCYLIYKFLCTCSKCYVGRTECTLFKKRANEHKQFSRAKKLYYHIHRCPVYVKKLLEYEKLHIPPKSTQTFIKKVRDKFYMSHFKIQQNNFRSFEDLCTSELCFIRINQPFLNEQIVHKNFTLF